MPDPPALPLTHYLLANPWPLGVGLLLVGAMILWTGARGGQPGRIRIGLPTLLAGIGVLALGYLVRTPGEHARDVTRAFVDATVAEDLTGAAGLLAPDVTLHFGGPRSVGHPRGMIIAGLSYLAQRYDIESNRITRLRGYTIEGDRGLVHLTCWTDAGGYGATPSQWVVEVGKADDGAWQIQQLTWVSVSGRAPPTRGW